MPSPEEDARAKGRFMVINLMRIGGIAMILMGIAVLQSMISLPDWTGYLLIVLGMMETFLVPTLLARVWSSNNRNPPSPPGNR